MILLDVSDDNECYICGEPATVGKANRSEQPLCREHFKIQENSFEQETQGVVPERFK